MNLTLLSSAGGVTSDVANTAVSLSKFRYQSRQHFNQSSGFIGCQNSDTRRARRLVTKTICPAPSRNITQIGQTRDLAVALLDSDPITVTPRQHKFQTTERKG